MPSLFPPVARRPSVRPPPPKATASPSLNLARVPLPPIGAPPTATSTNSSDVPAPLTLHQTPPEASLQGTGTPRKPLKTRCASAPLSRSASECISSDGAQRGSDFIRLPDFPTTDFRFSFFYLEPTHGDSEGTIAPFQVSQSFEQLLRVGSPNANADGSCDSQAERNNSDSADSIARADTEAVKAHAEAEPTVRDPTGEELLLQDCDAASRIYTWLPLGSLLKFRCVSSDLKDSLTEHIVRFFVDAVLDYYTLNNGNYETKLEQWRERIDLVDSQVQGRADGAAPVLPACPFPESAYPLFPARRMASQLVNMQHVLESHLEWGMPPSPALFALMLSSITDEQQLSLRNKRYYGHRLFSMLSSEVVGATRGVLLWPRWCPLYKLFSSWYSAPLLERPLSHVESMIVDIPFRILYSTQDPLRDPVGPLTSLAQDLPSQQAAMTASSSLPPIGLRISEIVARSAPVKVNDDPVAFRGLPLLANMPSMETSEDEYDTLGSGLLGSPASASTSGTMKGNVVPTSALIMQRLENAMKALPERFPLGLPANTRDEYPNNILLFVGDTSTPVLSEKLFPLHNGSGVVPPAPTAAPPGFWGAAPPAFITRPYSEHLFVVGIPTFTSVGTRFNIPHLRSVVFAGLTRVDTIGAGFLVGNLTVESVTLYNLPALTTIDDSFCSGCCNLKSVQISAPVSHIGKAFLANCLRLRALDLSETRLEELGTQFCTGAKQLSFVSFPPTLTKLGEQFLENCSALNALDLSNCQSLEAIPNHFLTNCTVLKRLALPNPVPKMLGPDVLLGCVGLPAETRQEILAGCGFPVKEKLTRTRSKSRPAKR